MSSCVIYIGYQIIMVLGIVGIKENCQAHFLILLFFIGIKNRKPPKQVSCPAAKLSTDKKYAEKIAILSFWDEVVYARKTVSG